MRTPTYIRTLILALALAMGGILPLQRLVAENYPNESAKAQIKLQFAYTLLGRLPSGDPSVVEVSYGSNPELHTGGWDGPNPKSFKSEIYSADIIPNVPVQVAAIPGVGCCDELTNFITYFKSIPANYSLYINGELFSSPGGIYRGNSYTIELRDEPTGAMSVGESTTPEVGILAWKVGLGTLPDGSSAGVIELRKQDITGARAFPAVYSPSSLTYVQPFSSDITLYRPAGVLRQIRTNNLVDIVDITNGYEIRFYKSGDFTPAADGVQASLVGSPTPWVKYEVKKPGTTDQLRITKYWGNTVVYCHEITRDFNNNTWEIKTSDSSAFTAASTRVLSKTYSGNEETVTVKMLSDTNPVTKSKNTYLETSTGVWQLDDTIEDPDTGGKAYTTDRTYYTSADSDTNTANRGLLKSIRSPNGGWQLFEYYGEGDDLFGFVKKTYSPFKDSPASIPALGSTAGVVTEFTYDTSNDYTFGQLLTQETKIDGVRVNYTTYSYDSSQTANSKRIIVTTQNNYTDSTNYLTTVSKNYYSRLTGDDRLWRGKPYSVENADGTKTVYLYQRGVYTPATKSFTPSTTTGTTDKGYRVVILHGTAVSTIPNSDQITSFDTGANNGIDSIYMVEKQSTIDIIYYSNYGLIARNETRIYNTGLASVLASYDVISGESINYDTAAGYKLTSSVSDVGGGLTVSNTYNAKGWVGTSIDATGTTTEYDYYPLGYVRQVSRQDASSGTTKTPTVAYWRDAEGRELASAKLAAKITGTFPTTVDTVVNEAGKIVTKKTYDLSGNPTWIITPAGARIKLASEKIGTYYQRLRESVYKADGTTLIREQLSENYLDGTTKSVTGSGVVSSYYALSVESNGFITMQVNTNSSASPEKKKTTYDFLGRKVKESVPQINVANGVLETNYTYYASNDATRYYRGHLQKSVSPNGASSYLEYDYFGKINKSGLDISGASGLQDASKDRIVYSSWSAIKKGSDWWLQTEQQGLPIDDAATKVILSRSETRLTGWSAGLAAESVVWGSNPLSMPTNALSISEKITIDTATKELKSTVDYPDATTDEVSTTRYGLLRSTVSKSGVSSTYSYDDYDRVNEVTGERGVKNYFKYITGTGLVDEIRENKNSVVAGGEYYVKKSTYYDDGQLKSEENALGKKSYYEYTARGEVAYIWGDVPNPTQYAYDTFGRRTHMYTYQSGTSWTGSTRPGLFGTEPKSTTVWAYDTTYGTGLLLTKTDAATKATTYGYDSYNRPSTITDARGNNTTYTYDSITAELLAKTYKTDATTSDAFCPNIAYSYNRMGQTASVTDVTGLRNFYYRVGEDQQIDYEALNSSFYGSNLRITNNYEDGTGGTVRGRYLGYRLGTTTDDDLHQKITIGYSSVTGRIASMTAGLHNLAQSHTFNYGWVSNSDLLDNWNITVQSTTPSLNLEQKRAYEPYRNLLNDYKNRLVVNGTEYPTSIWNKHALTRNNSGQITDDTRTGEIYKNYGSTTGAGGLKYSFQYTDRNELKKASAVVQGTTVNLPDRFWKGAYDAAGNRDYIYKFTDATPGTQLDYQGDFATNNLNQITETKEVRYDHFTGFNGTTNPVYVYDNEKVSWLTASRPNSGYYFDVEFDSWAPSITPPTADHPRWMFYDNGGNLMVNPGIETSAIDSPWVKSTSVSATSSAMYSGNYGMSNPGNSAYAHQNITVNNNTNYTVSVWAKLNSALSGNHYGIYYSLDGGTTRTYAYISSTTWTQLTMTFNSGSATTVRIGAASVSTSIIGACFDDFSLTTTDNWYGFAYRKANASPAYDLNGNIQSDGNWSYYFNTENQLYWMSDNNLDAQQFWYDYLGRRVKQVYYEWVGSAWTPRREYRFVYYGMNIIAELEDTTPGSEPVTAANTVQRTYVWGLDFDGTDGGLGGIGGLLLVDTGNSKASQFVVGYDAYGNVASLSKSDSSGTRVAEYEYSPWGELIRYTGPNWKDCPFRYQTKWDMDYGLTSWSHFSFGLTDYGLRYYRPSWGTFISRDPIQEKGGNNLYQAFGGDPINNKDYLGMDWFPVSYNQSTSSAGFYVPQDSSLNNNTSDRWKFANGVVYVDIPGPLADSPRAIIVYADSRGATVKASGYYIEVGTAFNGDMYFYSQYWEHYFTVPLPKQGNNPPAPPVPPAPSPTPAPAPAPTPVPQEPAKLSMGYRAGAAGMAALNYVASWSNFTAAFITSPTVAGSIIYGAAGTYYLDQGDAELMTAWTGYPTDTLFNRGLRAAGASEAVVTGANVVVGAASGVSTAASGMSKASQVAKAEVAAVDSAVEGTKSAAPAVEGAAAKTGAPAGQKLLGYTGKLADHHLMPRQFEKFFKSRGITIDDFTVSVDHNVTHLKAIHGTGNMGQMPGRWNQIWGDWIKANPNATSKEIFQQAGQMMDDFGIGHLKIHPYRKP
ncbi:MAG: RHS repeat-associated core domain-containing protein [Verrucomicrobiota bacterium]|nr:RHS repeat-associated core domain-containing protein [Verrucomicrobiota bacterium]